MTRALSPVRLVATLLVSLAFTTVASADSKTICVYDPLGTNGQAYKSADAMRIEAKAKYGFDIVLKPHVEEKTAADDLIAGKCDGAVVTGVSARSFGLPSATVEAIGALPDYDLLKTTIGALAKEGAAGMMINQAGTYETAGIYPAGAVFLYTRNKAWRKSSDLAGKSISTISGDDAAGTMVRQVGASSVAASTATFASLFNNGSVDACYAPTTAYAPLELYRGVGTNGGIIDFPLSQLTLQLVVKKSAFPDDFGMWARQYAYNKYDASVRMIKQARGEIPAASWVTIPDEDKPGYEQTFLEVRTKLRDKGVYDGTILKLMRKIRCKADATRAECAAQRE